MSLKARLIKIKVLAPEAATPRVFEAAVVLVFEPAVATVATRLGNCRRARLWDGGRPRLRDGNCPKFIASCLIVLAFAPLAPFSCASQALGSHSAYIGGTCMHSHTTHVGGREGLINHDTLCKQQVTTVDQQSPQD